MFPFTLHLPERRLMDRLLLRLKTHQDPGAFMAAGEALAIAVLASRGAGGVPVWAPYLADAMVGSLLHVQDATLDHAGAADRVNLGLSAAVLGAVHPHVATACDAAIATWLGWGAGRPSELDDPEALGGWTLLSLLLGDEEGAARAVDALLDREGAPGWGFILHDWAVATIQTHGTDRISQSFHHLRAAMARPGQLRPKLLVTAAVVLVEASGQPRRRTLQWLDEVADELRANGTAGCSPLSVMRR